jgi:hypothetical protein
MFPPWLESMRNELEKVLPPVHLPYKKERRATTVKQKQEQSDKMEIKPKMEKKTKHSFTHRFMTPEK